MTEEGKQQLFTFSVPLINREEKVVLQDCVECEKEYEIKNQRAVALIGDRFYQGAFLPASELEKAHTMWENSLHDINHEGTGIPQLGIKPDINKFIGYNKNVSYSPDSKAVSMDIHICDNTHYASAWRGYVELCELAGQTPNVSVSFLAKTKYVRASDLPKDVNYKAYGYSAGDMVLYVYDIKPQALSTVFRGACNDTQGCGIGKSYSESEDSSETNEEETPNVEEPEVNEVSSEEEKVTEQKRQEIIEWLKSHEKTEE